MSIVRTERKNVTGLRWSAPALTASAPFGYSPASLRAAYQLASASATRGGGRTVAIVDAYRDPRAASDLAGYRAQYHLPRCVTSNGCLRIVNEHGKAGPLPVANRDWAFEESLDLDMISAICPHCRILLVEAKSPAMSDMGKAENAAVAAGARFVSNSWSGPEFIGEQSFDHYFNHPGVAITFAAGDTGYGSAYPSDTQYVTAVGGTTLRRSKNARGWYESAWSGTGSGCAILATKAAWQTRDDTAPDGCLNRTGNDVAAVANPNTGVSVYDSYQTGGTWLYAGGTSVAAPIIAAVYALAGTPPRASYPAAFPYQHARAFNDVRSGSNGTCEPSRTYLCHGVTGYDGPTGLGTPRGTAGLVNGSIRQVTLLDPGTQNVLAGSAFSLRIKGLDENSGTTARYSASNLPPGLSIRRAAGSTDGLISGTLPAAPGTYTVTVTAKDSGTGRIGRTTFMIVSVGSLAASPEPGRYYLDGLCLDSGDGTAGSPALMQACTSVPSQDWAYVPDGTPGGPGELTSAGMCLGLSGAGGVIAICGGSSTQWAYIGFGLLQNAATGKCLVLPKTTAGTQITVKACRPTAFQSWLLPATLVTSGVTGLCLDDPGDSTVYGTQADVATCNAAEPAQQWVAFLYGQLQIQNTLCLDHGSSALDGAPIGLQLCNDTSSQQTLLPGPGGELIFPSTGKCLADPGDGPAGTGLVQQDCYGEAGEIWAFN